MVKGIAKNKITKMCFIKFTTDLPNKQKTYTQVNHSLNFKIINLK